MSRPPLRKRTMEHTSSSYGSKECKGYCPEASRALLVAQHHALTVSAKADDAVLIKIVLSRILA